MKYFIIVLLVAFIVNKGYCQTQWEHIGLDYETITSLAIDPTDDNIIYAGSFKDIWGGSIGGLYRTTKAVKIGKLFLTAFQF